VRVSKVGIDFHVHRDLPVGEIKSHSEIQLQLIPQSRSSRDWLHFFKLAERYDWYTPEVFDLYKRAARFSDLGSDWKDVPDLRMGYLLGYEATEAESRPLGVCLRQISEKILRDLDKDYP